MTSFIQFAVALAQTETGDDWAAWGDKGLACGRWQMHPAWVDRYWPDDIGVDWSWDRLFQQALLRFWGRRLPGTTPVNLAMEFHIGHRINPSDRAWDQAYAERFMHNYLSLEVPPAG